MSKKRVLITGAAGFLGSHLCDRFIKEGFHVIGMDNLITGDLRNIEHLFPLEENVEEVVESSIHRWVLSLGVSGFSQTPGDECRDVSFLPCDDCSEDRRAAALELALGGERQLERGGIRRDHQDDAVRDRREERGVGVAEHRRGVDDHVIEAAEEPAHHFAGAALVRQPSSVTVRAVRAGR